MAHITIRFGGDRGIVDSEFRRTVDEMLRLANPIFSIGHQRWRPMVDVYECADEIIVLVEAAGVKVEDISVELTRRSLKISGYRRELPLKESARYRLAEISYGYFERVLSWPGPIDTESAVATYADGLLQICIKKMHYTQTQRITVRNV